MSLRMEKSDMMDVKCKENKVLYSAYHLVRAFFPNEQVTSRSDSALESQIELFVSSDSCPENPASEPVQPLGGTVIRFRDVRELYNFLVKLTGEELPWGMLTGVRPVKLATSWIRENLGKYKEAQEAEAAFAGWFREEKLVSREKAVLAFDIAMRQKKILDMVMGKEQRGYSLYVGIPFCPSICSYCSFSSGPIDRYAGKVDQYLDALENEMKMKAAIYGGGGYPVSVYIGGGTPTSLNEERLERLLSGINRIFRLEEGLANAAVREFTVEAGRPDSITEEKLRILKNHGVTRISINPQSMQQKTLDIIGRKHTVEQIKETFELARRLQFDNINMDIIAGLPGETLEDVKDTLRQISLLSPDSLTVHSLSIKRASSMGIAARVNKNGKSEKNEACGANVSGDIAAMIKEAYDSAISMGMAPYYLYRQKQTAGNFENIGYAKEGKEGLYNIIIMEEVQSIAACGAGASSKTVTAAPHSPGCGPDTDILIERQVNVKSIDDYIKKYTVAN